MFRSKRLLSVLMVVVALLAIDLAVFRHVLDMLAGTSNHARAGAFCLLGLLPILTASALHLQSLATAIRARASARPFASGFVAMSLVAALAYVVIYSLLDLPALVFTHLQPLTPPISVKSETIWVPILLLGYTLVVSVPQFVVAALGGGLCHRYGIAIRREP